MADKWITDRQPYADELEPMKNGIASRWGRFLVWNGFSIDIEIFAMPPTGPGYWLGGQRHIKAWRPLPAPLDMK